MDEQKEPFYEPFKQYVAVKFEPHKLQPEELIEYYCPETGQSNETLYCENNAMNAGCKNIKTCPAYNKQKEFEKRYPTANWHLCFRKENNIFKELYIKLKMIKQGIIIEPNKQGEINEGMERR